jgi:1-aminocyclopropane-1-carboxylate deaminase
LIKYDPIIQKINSALFSQRGIEVSVLRLDLIHPQISGNKWFKLKYNLQEAKKQGYDTILTFGGAFSNHIHAAAIACKQFGFKSIGVIRGEETSETNSTLSDANQNGMQLHFVSREDYRRKSEPEFINELKDKFGDFYLIPESGDNELGTKGCEEILEGTNEFDQIFCACGTCTTYKGLLASIKPHQQLTGISVLKGEGEMTKANANILSDYHFGGYAKHTTELVEFKNRFEIETNIPLDYVYTAKLFFAVKDLIASGKIPSASKLLIVHSGGLQGNAGYEKRYALKPNRNVNEPQG